MTDRSDLRAAVMSAADDWRDDPPSWAAGSDPLKVLVTLQQHGEIPHGAGLPVYMAIARYVSGEWNRDQLINAINELIPDGEFSQPG